MSPTISAASSRLTDTADDEHVALLLDNPQTDARTHARTHLMRHVFHHTPEDIKMCF